MPRRLLLTGMAVLLLAGCAAGAEPSPSGASVPGFDRAVDHVVNPGGPDGGVLRLISTRDCGDWLPEQAVSAWCVNMQRLMTRQLMAYGSDAGRRGAVIVPDLAAGRGRPNEDRTSWTYELQPDVRWEDGQPITLNQVAEGIRTLDLARRDVSVTGIELGAPSTITVNLRRASTDFDALLALPVSAPQRDRGVALASGPFRIVSTGTTTVFERNPQWDQATDAARNPRVDRIEFTVVTTDAEMADELRAGRADLAAQGRMDSRLAAEVADDPTFAATSDNPGTGRSAMLAVPAYESVALRNVDCRRAVFSAVDRLGVVAALAGGVNPVELAAEPATSLSPPTIPSFDWSYQPFAVGDGSGDLDAARASLERCGQPSGFPVRLAFSATSTNSAIVASIAASLSRVGILVVGVPFAPVDYVRLTASPAAMKVEQIDLALLVQAPLVSGTWGFWNPLVSGDLVGSGLSTNVAQVRIPSVDILLRAPEITSTIPAVQENIGRMIDRLILDSCAYIPLATVKSILHRPPMLTNVTTNGALGNGYDLVQIGTGASSPTPARPFHPESG